MITSIKGRLKVLYDDRVILDVPPFELQVFVPEFVRRQLQSQQGEAIELFTIFYMDGNPMQGRMAPKLLGFQSSVEREFFDIFCEVKGIGTMKALRAMVRPVREIAVAIEEQNVKFLSSLPGIGPKMAEKIVAELRRKVPKFALMVDRAEAASEKEPRLDILAETYQALVSLGHSESEARRMIDSVVEDSKKTFKDSSELIQAIYLNNRN